MNGIQQTTDYDQFKNIKANRKLYPFHIANLTTSIMTKNMLSENPIVVNEKMEVVDGQHRLLVAKANKLPIYFMVIPDAGITEVRLLNANNREWSLTDFIDSYVEQGRENYIWLKSFTNQYTIAISVGLVFIFGQSGRWSTRLVKHGELTVSPVQREIATERADVLEDLRPFSKRRGSIPKAFILAIVAMHDKGLGKKLILAVKKKGTLFVPSGEYKENMRLFSNYMR